MVLTSGSVERLPLLSLALGSLVQGKLEDPGSPREAEVWLRVWMLL